MGCMDWDPNRLGVQVLHLQNQPSSDAHMKTWAPGRGAAGHPVLPQPLWLSGGRSRTPPLLSTAETGPTEGSRD